jgi:hypothetical protein
MPRLLLLMLAGGMLTGTGCVRCRYEALAQSQRPVEETTVSAPQRGKVYLVLVNGADLAEHGGIQELQQKVICGGFPKVYHAQRFDRAYFRKELHRLHREDCENRFILMGYGTAADQLLELACCVNQEGIPIDCVGFIDPAGLNAELIYRAPFRTIVFRSHHWRLSPRLVANELFTVNNVGHYQVMRHPLTADAVLELMTESATRVPSQIRPVQCLPMRDEIRPVPRPDEPKKIEVPAEGYEFLCPNLRNAAG